MKASPFSTSEAEAFTFFPEQPQPVNPQNRFSGPTTQKGWGAVRVAHTLIVLMQQLGYDHYGVHGSDWGAALAPEVGRFDSEHVVGVHVTEVYAFPSDSAQINALSEEEKMYWQRFLAWQQNQGIHLQVQSKAPQTLAHALADSPVGQLAWNYQDEGYYRRYGEGLSDGYILTTASLS